MVSAPKRGLRWAAIALMIAAAVFLACFPPDRYGFYPICPFHAATGLLCPGCGGTRAIAALLRGDWREAWHWNPLVVALTPFAVAYAVALARRLAQDKVAWLTLPRPLWVALAAITAAFGVMRNLPGWG